MADLVAGGCNVDTSQQYMSLFNSWHINVMGYGLVSSKAFEDKQYKLTNQGLRRLHPATKIDRAAHPTELNATYGAEEISRGSFCYLRHAGQGDAGPMASDREGAQCRTPRRFRSRSRC